MVRFQLLTCYVVRVPKQTTMTPRSIRRAAERKAMKLARKAERITPETEPRMERSGISRLALAEEPPPTEAVRISEARLAANRANALLSTGPKTPEGRAKVSLNAVKTALTGRTVLLPTDDATEYERHLHAFENELRPVGQRECDLVQSLADISWRLRRIPALEMAIYAQGRVEFAGLFEDQEDPGVRRSLIELHTHLTYERQLRNLQLQEARLARRREKETAELRTLQDERTGRGAPGPQARVVPVVRVEEQRNQREKQALDLASKLKPFDPPAHGFEFSIQENEQYVQGVRAANVAQLRHSDSCILSSAF
jgi:hypothetical protein